jgi:hypothetical protein
MKGYIYGIRDTRDERLIYIGSTQQRLLCMRKGDHTKPSTKKRPIHLYVADHGGWDFFRFECLYEGEFETVTDLRKTEQEWITRFNPPQNHQRAYLSREQYLADNREHQAKFRKAHPGYYQKYAEKQKERDAKRCETRVQCQCGGTYTLQNKSNHFSRQIHKRYEISLAEITKLQKEMEGDLHPERRNGNVS